MNIDEYWLILMNIDEWFDDDIDEYWWILMTND